MTRSQAAVHASSETDEKMGVPSSRERDDQIVDLSQPTSFKPPINQMGVSVSQPSGPLRSGSKGGTSAHQADPP